MSQAEKASKKINAMDSKTVESRSADPAIKETLDKAGVLASSLKAFEMSLTGKNDKAEDMFQLVKTMVVSLPYEILKNDKNLDQINKVIDELTDLKESDFEGDTLTSGSKLARVEVKINEILGDKSGRALEKLRKCEI